MLITLEFFFYKMYFILMVSSGLGAMCNSIENKLIRPGIPKASKDHQMNKT